MCGFIQVPDLKKMHSIIDRIDLKGRNNKRGNRSQSFCGHRLLGLPLCRSVIITDHLVLWIFISISLHTRPSSHSTPASIHSLRFFQGDFSYIDLKKKKAQWGSNSSLHPQSLCGRSTEQRRAEMCISVHRTKVFPSRCPKQGTREGKQVLGAGDKRSQDKQRMASVLADTAPSYLPNHPRVCS